MQNYRAKIKKKVLKKHFFGHPREACHCLKIKKYHLRVQADTFN